MSTKESVPVRGSIVLCTYNRAASLRQALASLCAMDPATAAHWELLIVDNNSSDDTRAVVAGLGQTIFGKVTYLFCGTPGKSHALNAGIAAAEGELLAFTDDDVTFDRQWLTEIEAGFADPAVMGLGGRIDAGWSSAVPAWYSEEGPYRVMGAIVKYDFGPAPKVVDDKWPPYGANMAFRRSVFAEHGGFRTDLGPHGKTLLRGEDTELVRRVLASGSRVLYWPKAIVCHPVEPYRLRRKYFRKFYFDYGRSLTRLEYAPSGSVRWFGVPRYLFRMLLKHSVLAAISIRPKPRFFHQLDAVMTMGRMAEERRLFTSEVGVTPSPSSRKLVT